MTTLYRALEDIFEGIRSGLSDSRISTGLLLFAFVMWLITCREIA